MPDLRAPHREISPGTPLNFRAELEEITKREKIEKRAGPLNHPYLFFQIRILLVVREQASVHAVGVEC